MPRASNVVLALLCASLLAGCGVPRALGIAPYKIEIQQGNYVSQDMLVQLKNGMSKDQVRQIMGTPLLNDIFHAERWDYMFSRVASDGTRESRRLALFYEDRKLVRIDGEAAPSRLAAAAPAPAAAAATSAAPPAVKAVSVLPPATEAQARYWVYGAFLTQAQPEILSEHVALGPELEASLGIASGADRAKIYEALMTRADRKPLSVRKATAEEVAKYSAGVKRELKDPLFAVQAGDVTLLVQYDLQANVIPFVGQLSAPPAAAAGR